MDNVASCVQRLFDLVHCKVREGRIQACLGASRLLSYVDILHSPNNSWEGIQLADKKKICGLAERTVYASLANLHQ